jgi:hypothetical protein
MIVDGPSSDDHTPYTDLDELARDAGSKPVAVPRRLDRPEMAAVEEYEVGHRFHRRDLTGGEKEAIREHNTGARLAVQVPELEDAVRRDVHDAPRSAQQRRDHLARRLVGPDH